MSALSAFESLLATLRSTGMRVLPDVGQAIDSPPALVISPPTLSFDVYSPEPTEASFKVALVVDAQTDRPIERLFALLPAVAQAVHDSDDAALTAAEPGNWGTPQLPCYLLTIEVSV